MKYRITFIFFVLKCLFSTSLKAEDVSKKNTSKKPEEKSEVVPRFDLVFDNPYLTQTLNAGSQVTNATFDSLLDGIFYRLLDNKFSQSLTGSSSINEQITRKVFTTGQGKYVIVDRVNIGPSYLKALPDIFQKIPITASANTALDLLSIYLRTDPQRIIESDTLPTWRYLFNTWFGFLPLLERILPPAFDPNFLYDPLHQTETIFNFPLDEKAFGRMEIGNIQSYAFQGSIAFPINIDGLKSDYIHETLTKLNLNIALPYTVYIDGEYRINVLKKSETIAWVGISKIKRGGHSFAGYIGTTIYLFANSLGKIPWNGLPAQFSPLDVNIVKSLIDKFDQVFEFDMSKKSVHKHFKNAIAGDFSFGSQNSLPDGVNFQFSQTSQESTSEKNNKKNFVLMFKSSSNELATNSEIKFQDGNGEYYVLETTKTYSDSFFNILTGEKSIDLSNEFDLNAEKEKAPDYTLEEPKFVYHFHRNMRPYQLILKFQIRDRFADVDNFYYYIDLLRKISQLSIEGIPTINPISEKVSQQRSQNAFFKTPNDTSYNLHPTSTIVGKFNATALVFFDFREIEDILSKNEIEIQKAFYKAFNRDPKDDLNPNLEYFRYYLFYPLRSLGLKFASIDAFKEIDQSRIKFTNHNPKNAGEILETFNRIFTTDYPFELISALFSLCNPEKIPRKVTLYISPSNELDDSLKKELSDLNEKTFESKIQFPEPDRYRIAKNKLYAFVPSSLKDDTNRILIEKVTLDKTLTLRISLKNDSTFKKRFYINLQSTGRFKVAQTNLGRHIFEASSLKVKKKYVGVYEFSPFVETGANPNGFNINSLNQKSNYVLLIAVSELDGTWSEEISIPLTYKNGSWTSNYSR